MSVHGVKRRLHLCLTNYELTVGALAVTCATLAFFLLFWNRFAGIRTANGSAVAGQYILHGRLPYRDWFTASPPYHALKSALEVWFFGTAMIVPRAFALLERTLLALVVYLWAARLFTIWHAMLGAIAAIIVSAGDIADPISSYNHDTILFAVCSGYFASSLLGRRLDPMARVFSLFVWHFCRTLFFYQTNDRHRHNGRSSACHCGDLREKRGQT